MTGELYRYRFEPHVSADEVEDTLLLALLAAEALHGEAQVRLDAAHHFDRQGRACVIDASTAVGCSVNKLFTTFLRQEFGALAFKVERAGSRQAKAVATP